MAARCGADGPTAGSWWAPSRRRSCSCLSEGLTEDTGGSDQQDHDEQDEGDDVLPLAAEDGRPPVLRDPEDQSAQECPTEVADPAENRGGERLDAEKEAGVLPGGPD